MRKKQNKLATMRLQKPIVEFGKDKIIEPEILPNPIKEGIQSRLNKPTYLELNGVKISLTTTNIACLAAIALGRRYTYDITKVFGWKHGTILYSLRSLHGARGLIELDDTSHGGGAEPSAWRPQLTKTMFRLTELGEAAVRALRETSTFFAECETWLRIERVDESKAVPKKKPPNRSEADEVEADSTNPIRHGMESNKLIFLEVGDEIVPLTTTQVACLTAVDYGFDYTYTVRKVYQWKLATIHNALRSLHVISNLIEPDTESTGTRYTASIYRENLTKIQYKLTQKGKAALKVLRETNNPFFAECQIWLRKRRLQKPE